MQTLLKAITLLAFIAILSPAQAQSKRKLNVLFIAIDDLRTELPMYRDNGVIAPNITRLAEKSLRFNNAFCQYPVCNPSRASFMTGKRPHELDILSNKTPLRKKYPNVVTLPQLFRQNGYYTAGLGKLLHLGLDENGDSTLFRDDLSFDYGYRALGNNPKIGRTGEGRKLGDGTVGWAQWLAAEGGDEAQPDGMLAAEAVKVIEANHDKPFFIGVGFHKPHDPFIAPKEYFELYPLESVKLAQAPGNQIPPTKHALPDAYNFPTFTERDEREFKRAYHACTTFVDAQVGKLFEAMDRLDLWDSTIVILMGDHGYHLGEHGWWNKVTVFDQGAKAPLLMWVPGAKAMGSVAETPVEFVDLYPSLADLCGFKPPHKLSGKSLRPVLSNPKIHLNKPAFTQVKRGQVDMGYSVRHGDWRLVQWGKSGKGGWELYNATQDPDGYYNVAADPQYATIRENLKQILASHYPEVTTGRH